MTSKLIHADTYRDYRILYWSYGRGVHFLASIQLDRGIR